MFSDVATDADSIVVQIAPGDRPDEEVGNLPDGRQFLLTTNLCLSLHEEPESKFLLLVIFDSDGAALEATVKNLGLASDLSEADVTRARVERLKTLGAVKRGRIEIQPIDPSILDPRFGPITLTCEEDPELRVTIPLGRIIPGVRW